MDHLTHLARLAHAWAVTTLGNRDKGATAVEYGIMVAAIAAVIIAVVVAVGNETDSAFQDVNTELAGIS